MVPSAVPNELSGLTQVEEMLIARALVGSRLSFYLVAPKGAVCL